MPKPTPEELAEEEKRSTPHSFFHYAYAYWRAALDLQQAYSRAAQDPQQRKLRAGHKDAPLYFLYYHAVELYLKAFLLAHGFHPYELRTKYGHDVGKLSRTAAQLGLSFSPADAETFRFMSATALGHRYLVTGPSQRLREPALDEICRTLHVSVGNELRAKDYPVRI